MNSVNHWKILEELMEENESLRKRLRKLQAVVDDNENAIAEKVFHP